MGLDELRPENTKRAKDTAAYGYKFGMYLAFNEGKKGKPLARNTAMQYFRQSKMWLFELFPVQQHIVEAKLLSMGKTFDSFCMKRDGKVVNKAPPCSKSDLKKMMLYLYENASSASDYQDAALLCLLWYLFGRASDLSLVRKQNLSVDAGKVFFVRFIRMKTSEEQGLSLFPDADFVTCPLHAIAMAIVTQTAPTVALIDNLPDVPSTACYRIARVAGVSDALTSHSFRRGGTQHVDGCDGLTQRWIFDRGAWNMSTTNKGFNNIFKTSREGHKVSIVLSGYDTKTKVTALDLKLFDTEAQEKIADVQHLLFMTFYRMESAKHNLYGQAVRRLESAAVNAGASVTELLAWSSHLAVYQQRSPRQVNSKKTTPITEQINQSEIIDHQRSVIDQLMEHIKRQDERMDNLEAKMDGTSSQDKNRKRQRDSSQEQDKPKRRRGSVTNLHSIWFAWYAQEPRMWQSTISKQQKSDAKLLVAFMKLFLDGGFELDTTAPDYRDQVLSLGILNANFERYQRLIQTAVIKDPAPGYVV
ncbi:Hypothetical protein PHPALM_4745 [Phytophthora palmivora]|uniref:Ndc10 domain-containing protein n=1 Tax=Phytophthora palmivora TaxID=4796 RepID=A0A2P4YJ97_9STRA|nr:Hypothetical protein PHPALM_4745 [Phytophthora palmivora]